MNNTLLSLGLALSSTGLLLAGDCSLATPPSGYVAVAGTSAIRVTIPLVQGTDQDPLAPGHQVDVCVGNSAATGRIAFFNEDNAFVLGRTNGAGDNGVADHLFAVGGKIYATGKKGSTRRIWTPTYVNVGILPVRMSGVGNPTLCGKITVPDGFQSSVDEDLAVAGTQVDAYTVFDGGRIYFRRTAGAAILGRSNGAGDNPDNGTWDCYNIDRTAIALGTKGGKNRAWTPQFNGGSVKLVFNTTLSPDDFSPLP